MNKRNCRAFTLIELFVVLVILFIIVSLAFSTVGGCQRSDGSRVGYITKFSNRQPFNTWEGELLQGGMTPGNASAWAFSVDKHKPQVIRDVQTALEKNQLVRVRYTQKAMTSPFDGATKIRVEEVVPIEPAAQRH